MAVELGKNLIALLGTRGSGAVSKAHAPKFTAQTEYNALRGTLGNPNQPETRVAGLKGDNIYYFA
jgi:hypothetical protein